MIAYLLYLVSSISNFLFDRAIFRLLVIRFSLLRSRQGFLIFGGIGREIRTYDVLLIVWDAVFRLYFASIGRAYGSNYISILLYFFGISEARGTNMAGVG